MTLFDETNQYMTLKKIASTMQVAIFARERRSNFKKKNGVVAEKKANIKAEILVCPTIFIAVPFFLGYLPIKAKKAIANFANETAIKSNIKAVRGNLREKS